MNLNEIRKRADEAYELIGELCSDGRLCSDNYDIIALSILDILAIVDELDKIVRCGECENYYEYDDWNNGNPITRHVCGLFNFDFGENGYCSRGVRKKSKEEDE